LLVLTSATQHTQLIATQMVLGEEIFRMLFPVVILHSAQQI
jgi:hypothetical protein